MSSSSAMSVRFESFGTLKGSAQKHRWFMPIAAQRYRDFGMSIFSTHARLPRDDEGVTLAKAGGCIASIIIKSMSRQRPAMPEAELRGVIFCRWPMSRHFEPPHPPPSRIWRRPALAD